MLGKPVPFYYDLELCLTQDRVWVELSARHPVLGRTVWDSWGMLRPSGPVTRDWICNALWTAALELTDRDGV
jgi:hypothetical protein